MYPDEKTNQIELTRHLFEIICTCVGDAPSGMPQSVHLANGFFAKVLFFATMGKEPRASDFERLGFVEDDGTVFQQAVYLWGRWREMGDAAAVFHYCKRMNNVLARAYRKERERNLEDLCRHEREILSLIRKMKGEDTPKTFV